MTEASRQIQNELGAAPIDRGATTRGPSWRNRTGHVIGERYRLEAIIDSGGQGVVYRGRDLVEGDEVAVKVLKDSVAKQSDWRERLLREAHALAALSGTAAVRVLDQRWTNDGVLCLVMELLRGADLETVLERVERKGVAFPVDGLELVFDPVVSTLERAHVQGILHRDIKPANIYVVDGREGPEIKLLDFGFAKFVRMKSFTQAGFIAGSPSYIAPEMWAGASELDARIDVYSLAAVLFRALAGRPPFQAPELIALCQMVMSAPRPSLRSLRPDLPAAVDSWAEQSLAANPAERFTGVRGMFFALMQALGRARPSPR